ncbi:MAG TPA: TetR family transcriptional regulator [Streptosporangiaceae bacterium]
MTDRTRATGRRRTLDRAAIATAARRVVEADGIDALTLRRVAQELGTGQASLYRHIADRADLLAALFEDVLAEFPLVEPRGDPARAVERQWRALHDHLAERPWLVRLIADGAHAAEAAESVADHGMGLLADTGLTRADARRAYRALWHLLLGHLLNEHPFGHHLTSDSAAEDDTTAEPDFAWALRHLLAGILAGRDGR